MKIETVKILVCKSVVLFLHCFCGVVCAQTTSDNSALIERGHKAVAPLLVNKKVIEIDLDNLKPKFVKPDLIFGYEPNGNFTNKQYFSNCRDLLAFKDTLLILDDDQNCFFISDFNGNIKRKIGRDGKGPGEYNRPACIDRNDDYYIIHDQGNARVQILDRLFNYKKSFFFDYLPLSSNLAVSSSFIISNSMDYSSQNKPMTYKLNNLDLSKTDFLEKQFIIKDFIKETLLFYDFMFAADNKNRIVAALSNLPYLFVFDGKGKLIYVIKMKGKRVNELKKIQKGSHKGTRKIFARDVLVSGNIVYYYTNRLLLIFDLDSGLLKKSYSLVGEKELSGPIALTNSYLFVNDKWAGSVNRFKLND